eukprot:5519301-Amphidinium_carterae.1
MRWSPEAHVGVENASTSKAVHVGSRHIHLKVSGLNHSKSTKNWVKNGSCSGPALHRMGQHAAF